MLGLRRSKVYYTPAQPTAEQVDRQEQIMARIDYWHTTMPYLGTRKLVKKLAGDGVQVGRKLVRRLMAEMGICAVYPKQNLSKRNFEGE